MSVDTTLTDFYSGGGIDKIQSWSSSTDSSAGLSSGYQFTIPANPAPGGGLIEGTGTVTNTYGTHGLPHLSWSIDNVNWYSMGGQIIYFNPTLVQYLTQIAVALVSNDDTLTFIVTTGYTSPQTVYVQFAVDNIL